MRFFVETFGCTMNQGETRELAETLSSLGHVQVASELEADTVLVNTCVVIRPTELKIMRRLRQLNQDGKEMIITGCIPAVQMDALRAEFPDSLILAPKEYPLFLEKAQDHFGTDSCAQPARSSEVSGILPVSQGCLGNCTYCLTKKARGHLASLSIEEVAVKAEELLARGAKELLLTAQDTGCYGQEIGTDLAHLITRLTEMDQDFWMRIGMMNPDSISEFVPSLVHAWSHPKVYKFIHLPVQSGSQSILKGMGRSYDIMTFVRQVGEFRRAAPDMSLATDIITGFPGETVEDHQMSMELIKKVGPNIVNVTRFSPRPGTPAAKAKGQVPSWISKERSREMTKLRFEVAAEHYSRFLGRNVQVLLTELGKKGTYIGRTPEYAPIVLPRTGLEIGSWVNAEVVNNTATHLLGRPL